jgi:KDO2-lipid IV(A) lauroyltransferase
LGHFGNWEGVSSLILYISKEVVCGQIYRKIHDKLFEKIMLANRSRFGATNIEMQETLRWIHEKVENNIISTVGYIADQSPNKYQVKYFLHFLNHNVPIFTGTEKIVKKYGMDAFYLDIRRVKRGYYEGTFIKMIEDPQSLPDFELTAIFFKYLEVSIRKQPELYLWTHKRFKHAKAL